MLEEESMCWDPLSCTPTLLVRSLRRRIQNLTSRDQETGSVSAATITSPGGRSAMLVVARSLTIRWRRMLSKQSWPGSKLTERRDVQLLEEMVEEEVGWIQET